MIYEIAVLPIHPSRIERFQRAFAEVEPLLDRAKGHIAHVLAQGVESPEVFNLIVQWQTLEDHTPGFEASDDHQAFMAHLEAYFSEEPRVYHLQGAAWNSSGRPHP